MASVTNTAIPIPNINFAIENKTQTQQAEHSVTGVFFFFYHNLDLNTVGEKPSMSLLD